MNEPLVLEKKALQAARQANWNQAIELNQKFLGLKPKDTAALNRLARAYTEVGFRRKAVCAYKKVLEIDKYNQIAERNLKKLDCHPKTNHKAQKKVDVTISFLEEKGKTKIIKLIKPAIADLVKTLHFAEELQLVSKRKSVIVKDCADRYVGALPDDVGFKLNRMIEKGNQYAAWVKNAENQEVIIFIRETYQSPELAQTSSF